MSPYRLLVSYTGPLHTGRHPFQTFMMGLMFAGALPILTGHIPSGSVSAEVPYPLAVSWGLMLVLGGSLSLAGAYWRGDWRNALTLEWIGLSASGFASFIYAPIILFSSPFPGSSFASAVVLGLGIASLRRVHDIRLLFRWLIDNKGFPK